VKAIEFYTAALGAEEIMRMPTPDGRLMHASLKIGDAALMLCDDFPEYCGGVSRAPNGPSPVTLHLNVDSADAAIAKAAAAGATVTMPAADMFWGDRYGRSSIRSGTRGRSATRSPPSRRPSREEVGRDAGVRREGGRVIPSIRGTGLQTGGAIREGCFTGLETGATN